MVASFRIDNRSEFKGLLIYKLQRKYIARTDNRFNDSTISIVDTATNLYLLVVWDAECHFRSSRVYLIEYANDFTWNEDELWAFYRDYKHELFMRYRYGTVTWLTNSGAVVRTRLDITHGSDYKLDIILSEGTRKYSMEETIKFGLERLVMPLLRSIVLMCVVRVCFQPSVKLNIHNQCLNVDLVSPAYIIHGWLDCHRPLNYKVCAGDIARSGFIVYNPLNAPGGVLIYRLQRRQSHESIDIDRNTSNIVHLLVIWEVSRPVELYTDVLLVEHDKGYDWNEVDLKRLYRENTHRFRMFPNSVTETWSLDDNIALMTTSKIMNEDHILDITISEVERNNCVKIPALIDMKR
jgi:hypothetical protein